MAKKRLCFGLRGASKLPIPLLCLLLSFSLFFVAFFTTVQHSKVSAVVGEAGRESSDVPGAHVATRPHASSQAAGERAQLVVSSECKTSLRQVIELQRGGWGDMSPSSLYAGANMAFAAGLRDFLPESPPRRVLDVGCGMALYNFFLFKHYDFVPSMHLYLFDKTTRDIDSTNTSFVGGGWHPDNNFSFYTSLECAAEILRNNTGLHENVHEVEANVTNLQRLEAHSFDIIFSLLSYGHHYPVSVYLQQVYRLLRVGGVLILDLRVKDSKSHVVEGLTELEQQGFSCTIVRHRRRGKTVRCMKSKALC